MLHRVVDEAGVVLLVIDARNPVGCRSWLVEEEVSRREAGSKRLVCVLNKIGAHAVYLPPPFPFSDRLGALREFPGMDDASPSYEEQVDTSAQIGLVTTLRTQKVRHVRVLI